MFIGSGIDEIWKTDRERAMFYQGYGDGEMNFTTLASHRYERVIEDLVVLSEQLSIDRRRRSQPGTVIRWFQSNFEPEATIEIADATYNSITENPNSARW